jgi:hypothetical protein
MGLSLMPHEEAEDVPSKDVVPLAITAEEFERAWRDAINAWK